MLSLLLRRGLCATKAYPPHQLVGLPALSPTMSSGIIGEWKVQVGEAIKPGTVLVDIMTDKASVDFDATEEGFMAKHLVASGTENIPVGAPVCIIVEDKQDVAAFADYEVKAAAAPVVVEKVVEVAAAAAAPPPKPVAAPVKAVVAAAVKAAPKPATAAAATPASSSPLSRVSPALLAQCVAYEKQFGNTYLVPKPVVAA